MSFFILISIALNLQATVLRVNNLVNAPYTTAQQAHNAAIAGDTIQLESSPNHYGSLICSKQLIWMGAGYFLNTSPFPQYIQNTSRLSTVTVNSGSSQSKFIGIEFQNPLNLNSSATVITRCLFGLNAFVNLQANSNGTVISSCFFKSDAQVSPGYSPSILGNNTASNPVSGVIIENNFFYNSNHSSSYPAGSIYLDVYFTGTLIFNNIFAGAYNKNPITIGYGYIKNNIFNQVGNFVYSYSAAAVTNNIFMNQTNTNYVGSNGNTFDPGTISLGNNVFEGILSTTTDTWMKLKVGSPALGAGEGGIDCGVFAGNTPYKPNGLPPIPTISAFQANSAPGNVLPCVISTRSNN